MRPAPWSRYGDKGARGQRCDSYRRERSGGERIGRLRQVPGCGGHASNLADTSSPAQLRAVLNDWVLTKGLSGLGSLRSNGAQDELFGGLDEDWFHALAKDLLRDYRPLDELDHLL